MPRSCDQTPSPDCPPPSAELRRIWAMHHYAETGPTFPQKSESEKRKRIAESRQRYKQLPKETRDRLRRL